jgi:hypothetical protein
MEAVARTCDTFNLTVALPVLAIPPTDKGGYIIAATSPATGQMHIIHISTTDL